MNKITVGSRGSRLALSQTHWVIGALKEKHPECEFEVKIIKTKGDVILDKALDKIGDKGLFVTEIESGLLNHEIDFAVHSMKDMPGDNTEGLCFAMTPVREDPRDVLIFKENAQWTKLEDLPAGAVIGTGSKRRMAQLNAIRPDLTFVPVRGNVETRIHKIETENLAGVVLAAAGLHRLGLKDRIGAYLEPDLCLPAPAQGALGIQYRTTDKALEAMLKTIGCEKSHMTAVAERAFLKGISGSCHLPIGAYAQEEGEVLKLTGLYGDEDCTCLVKASLEAKMPLSPTQAENLGSQLAEIIMIEYRKNRG